MAIYIKISGTIPVQNEYHEFEKIYPFSPACEDVDLAVKAALGACIYESVSEYGMPPEIEDVTSGIGTWLEELDEFEFDKEIEEYKEDDYE